MRGAVPAASPRYAGFFHARNLMPKKKSAPHTSKEKGNAGYQADSIQVLKGLEAVRRRPAMYIGSVSARGLHHLVYEVVDNSVDEALAGYCTEISVTIHADNSVTVVDNGRGIPVDIHKTEKKPGVEVALTVLHAGGKFDKSTYKVSGGLHGVGVSVVNALSEKLEVWVDRDGERHHMAFERGDTKKQLEVTGKAKGTGTTVWFKPDTTIFTETRFDYATIANRLRELAFLNKGLTITLKDERKGQRREETFYYKGGLAEFVKWLIGSRKTLHPKPITFEATRDGDEIEGAVQYDDQYSENTFTFVNNINTHEGGTHLTGFKSALTRTINEWAKKDGALKKEDFTLSGDDVREGLNSVLHVKVKNPQFEGQTKTKLGNSEVEGIVKSVVNDGLGEFFDKNPSVARIIIAKALSNEEIRTIITAIGTGVGEDFKLDEARYHKIIIMTDADVDGAHIRTLLLTFFYKEMKDLIDAGYIYIAQPPLFRVAKGKDEYYAYDQRERDTYVKRLANGEAGHGSIVIQRYKGLGEMNPDQLRDTTMDAARRTLLKVTMEDAVEASDLFETLMGDEVEPRRKFIEENAKFVRNLDV